MGTQFALPSQARSLAVPRLVTAARFAARQPYRVICEGDKVSTTEISRESAPAVRNTNFPSGTRQNSASHPSSGTPVPTRSPWVGFRLFRTHREASPQQIHEELPMPMWISKGYLLILLIGLPVATIFWLTGITEGLAVSLVLMLIFALVVFSSEMRKIESLDPIPPPK